MEKVLTAKTVVLTTAGGVASILTKIFGGWGQDMTTLLIFMGADFVLGLLIAGVWKKSGKSESGALNSWSAWKGLVRKGATLLVVLIAHRLDLMIGTEYIRMGVVFAFCTNELISIVENLGIMGVPLPGVIKKAIEILQDKSGEVKKRE